MPSPAHVLPALRRLDDSAPRITWYDLGDGPTSGERVELSARVLANWVAKAANALVEEWDVGPGARVALDVPPHWRSLYWALATWSVGATVVTGRDDAADVLVTSDPQAEGPSGATVLVTLAALARSASSPVGAGVVDEAKELATFGDRFDAWQEPARDDPALVDGDRSWTYADVVPSPAASDGPRVLVPAADLGAFLREALTAYARGGSVVLVHGGDPERLEALRLAERVSAG